MSRNRSLPLKIQRRPRGAKGFPLVLVDDEHGRLVGVQTRIELGEIINGQANVTVKLLNVTLALDEEYE